MVRFSSDADEGGPESGPLPGTLLWLDPDSDDPDLGFRFVVPNGSRITITAPLVGFLLRCVHKPPELHCRRVPEGWSLTVVVGLSLLFRSTRSLRLPAHSFWRGAAGRLLDLPLQRLVKARLSFGESVRQPKAGGQPQRNESSPISVKQHPPEQLFAQHFPVRVALPGTPAWGDAPECS